MLKTKLYFNEDNKIKLKEEFIIPNIRTGTSCLSKNELIDSKITNKLIKTGIYHSDLLNKKIEKEFLLFNKSKFCELLSNNINLVKLCKHGRFNKKLNFYINELNNILNKLSEYFINSLDMEKKINIKIEYFRQKSKESCENLSKLLIDYRNFTFNLRVIIYQELLDIWYSFNNIHESIQKDNTNILIDLNNFINTENKYINFNDNFEAKISFYDNRFYIDNFTNHDKVISFITKFENKIKEVFNTFTNSN